MVSVALKFLRGIFTPKINGSVFFILQSLFLREIFNSFVEEREKKMKSKQQTLVFTGESFLSCEKSLTNKIVLSNLALLLQII